MPYMGNDNDDVLNDSYYDLNNLNSPNNQNILNYEEQEKFEIRLTKDQIITVGNCPTRLIPDPPAKYVGKFLCKSDKNDNNSDDNALVLGMCAEKRKSDIEYKPGDSVAVSYILLRSLYSFNAKIINIREAVDEDRFDTGDMLNELTSIYGYNNYIFEVAPLTVPEKQQRREFFRMPLKIDIYYKPVSEADVKNMKNSDLKFDPELAKEIKRDADDGTLETDGGYSKLSTIDVSAGGFKCKYHVMIGVNAYLKCMLIVNNEALPVIARIVGVKPDERTPRLYDLRASFDKISDLVRDRLVKYIFYQQRQLQAKFLKRRF